MTDAVVFVVLLVFAGLVIYHVTKKPWQQFYEEEGESERENDDGWL